MLNLKDKLELTFKFLFLAVFTYGVITLTCCKKSCSSKCSATTTQCSKSNAPVTKECGPNCSKPCCDK